MIGLTLADRLYFGKHEGEKVESVLAEEPVYLRWLMENTRVKFDDEVSEALAKRERGEYWRPATDKDRDIRWYCAIVGLVTKYRALGMPLYQICNTLSQCGVPHKLFLAIRNKIDRGQA